MCFVTASTRRAACRTTGDAPEVDGNVCVSSEEPLYPGQFYDVLVDDSDLYDLYGTVAK